MPFTLGRAARVLGVAALFLVAAGIGLVLFRRPIAETVSIDLAQRDVAAAFHKRRLNFVVLGKQEDEGTTDTIILAHLDLDRRIGTLVSIPRDTWVAIPGHGHQKLNSAYAFGGGKLTAQLLGQLTGAHIDATIEIDPVGAKQLVDALGGLNVDVERDMDYDDNNGNLHIHLKHGEQFLSGGQVLEYMRFRHDAESDWGRMRRQQQVVHEIVKELGEPQNWSKVPRLVQLARKDVTTPLDDAQLRALVELYRGVPPDNVRSFTLPGRPDFVGDASVVVIDERWAKIVGSLVCSPEDPPQDVVLVANATGLSTFSKTVVAALRGGGWNVRTFVDEPEKPASEIVGSSPAARRLVQTFAGFAHRPGAHTVLRLGLDALPST
jgi:LCP family protein required for cell wall assembly